MIVPLLVDSSTNAIPVIAYLVGIVVIVIGFITGGIIYSVAEDGESEERMTVGALIVSASLFIGGGIPMVGEFGFSTWLREGRNYLALSIIILACVVGLIMTVVNIVKMVRNR